MYNTIEMTISRNDATPEPLEDEIRALLPAVKSWLLMTYDRSATSLPDALTRCSLVARIEKVLESPPCSRPDAPPGTFWKDGKLHECAGGEPVNPFIPPDGYVSRGAFECTQAALKNALVERDEWRKVAEAATNRSDKAPRDEDDNWAKGMQMAANIVLAEAAQHPGTSSESLLKSVADRLVDVAKYYPARSPETAPPVRTDPAHRVGCGAPSPLSSDGGCQRAYGHDGDHTSWHPTSGGSGSWRNRERASGSDTTKGTTCYATKSSTRQTALGTSKAEIAEGSSEPRNPAPSDGTGTSSSPASTSPPSSVEATPASTSEPRSESPNASQAWKAVVDGAAGFDCEHEGRRVAVTIDAKGGVEIYVPPVEHRTCDAVATFRQWFVDKWCCSAWNDAEMAQFDRLLAAALRPSDTKGGDRG